jgi:hypothetical protein
MPRFPALTRRVSLLAGATAIALAAGTLSTPSATGASSRPLPTKDSFYRYDGSTPLKNVKRGTVLKKRSVDISVGSSGQTPVPAEQLLYRTEDEQGKPAVTVTTVISPAGGAPSRVIGYLSFYDALGSECDPSYTLAGGYAGNSANEQQAEEEEAIISDYLGQGAVVTVPDFEGTRLDWAAGQESGRTTLDAMTATENYLALPASTPVGLTGYSGGSIGAEWASEIAARYAPKVNLVGVAEGGVPVDFAHNLHYINGSPDWSGVIPAVLVSLSRAFGVNVKHYLSSKGRTITHQVRHECIGSFVGNYPHLHIQSLLKPRYRNFLHQPVFARIVNKLIMGTAPGHPREPLFIAVGKKDKTGDAVMVTRDDEALAHEYCSQGVSVDFKVYKGSDHTAGGEKFDVTAQDAESFLQQAFAGTAPSNCASVGKGNSLKPIAIHHHRH